MSGQEDWCASTGSTSAVNGSAPAENSRTSIPQLPLGGVKDSGWGRSGPASMADFTELQWITTRDGTGSYPI